MKRSLFEAIQQRTHDPGDEVLLEVHRILAEAYVSGQRFQAVNRWLKTWFPQLCAKHGWDFSAMLGEIRNIHPLPLTGRFKRRKIERFTSPEKFIEEYQDLVKRFEEMRRRRKHDPFRRADRPRAYWDPYEAFPDVSGKLLLNIRRYRDPRSFARKALAERYGTTEKTVQRHLAFLESATPYVKQLLAARPTSLQS